MWVGALFGEEDADEPKREWRDPYVKYMSAFEEMPGIKTARGDRCATRFFVKNCVSVVTATRSVSGTADLTPEFALRIGCKMWCACEYSEWVDAPFRKS